MSKLVAICELLFKEPAMVKERPLTDLQRNSIYISLKLRDGSPNNFHWALYVHKNAQEGGIKYHITGSAGKWYTAHLSTFEALKEMLSIGVLRIGSYETDRLEFIDGLARKEDHRINAIEGITCRVWVGRVCERLKEEEILDFESWDQLEMEIMEFGNENIESCSLGQQPRPMTYSRVCGLTG